MRFKIRVKYLILLVLILIIGYTFILPRITLAIARHLDARESPRAQVYYDRYIALDSSLAARLKYTDAMVASFEKFTIYQQGWGGGPFRSLDSLVRTENVLREGLEKDPPSREEDLYIKIYTSLMDIYIAKGDYDQLRSLVDFGMSEDLKLLNDYARIYDSYLSFIAREYDRAMEAIDQLRLEGVDDDRLRLLEAEITLFKGDIMEAKSLYKKLWNGERMFLSKDYFGSSTYSNRLFWLNEYEEIIGGENVIRGRVMFEDEPIPFVEVYGLLAGGGLRIGGNGFIAITDENGYFESIGLSDGLYDIGIGIDGRLMTDRVFQKNYKGYVELPKDKDYVEFNFRDTIKVNRPEPLKLVEDAFTVAWEPLDSAEYYEVEALVFTNPMDKSGGNFRRPLKDIEGRQRIQETEANFRISDYENYVGGLSFSGDEWLIGPGGILGIFIPGVEYPIVVSAYDSNGDLISRSVPMRAYYDNMASIKIPGSLSKGQILVSNSNYPEAIDFYEEILLEDGSNQEAITSLSKLYGIGWKKGEKNLDRALSLLEELDNESLKANILSAIFFQMDDQELKEYEGQIRDGIKLIRLSDSDGANYIDYRLNRARGDYDLARDSLNRLEEYIPDSLIFLHIYFGDYDLAVEALEDDRFYPSRLQGDKFKSAILGLSMDPPPEDEMDYLKGFLLRMIGGGAYEERAEIYRSIESKVGDENILKIVDEIYNDRHWNY